MQNVGEETLKENEKLERVSGLDLAKSPHSNNSSPIKNETDTFSALQPRYMTDSSVEDEDDVSEEDGEPSVDPETQARLEALLEAAGIGKLHTGDGKQLADPEVLRRLTSSVSCALDEAAAALTRMRTENTRPPPERTLVEACSDGDVGTVKKLLTEGRSVHETTEEGESLLSLACSAGYYELAQVLLAMHANVEDRGIKGDCTPLMEASSSGYAEIVKLLILHRADVNAQSTSGNTPLMYACAGGHNEVVKILLDAGANVEDHNENGHTPLMEAASAGHVNVAATLLEKGAGINTHSNEFKESALTLACYKGHLDMVRFLLAAGADQEHKTDEMHTALMEASMDGHVEVAKLLLDSGAQVNMPTDSFESPLTLAACGGHVDLALLLIERGANIEEVNDEGYTPLMEAAREGHDEMVKLLLSKGANINAQTEETQETALTLACCGGFLDVADYLILQGAEVELGASTPLMEAAQEGHLDLVRYLVEHNANVNAQTQTGDTALTYSCENGHTEVAKLLLEFGADLEHESEGGRTPLMKACRAGHLNTVRFLLSRQANVNKQTANNDHTPLSLAAAGGHIAVVQLLLAHQADPFHKLKDNSTMLIEAAKGGHTNVVQLLLDFPHSIMMTADGSVGGIADCDTAPPSPIAVTPPDSFSLESLNVLPPPPPVLPPPVTHSPQGDNKSVPTSVTQSSPQSIPNQPPTQKSSMKKRLSLVLEAMTPQDSQQLTKQQISVNGSNLGTVGSEVCKEDVLDKGGTVTGGTPGVTGTNIKPHHLMIDPQYYQRQQIVQELQRVEEELKEKVLEGVSLVSEGVSMVSSSTSPSLVDFFPPPSSPHSNSLIQEGSVVDLICESMAACDSDMVYHGTPLIVHDPSSRDQGLITRDQSLVACDPGLFVRDSNVGLTLDTSTGVQRDQQVHQSVIPSPSMIPLPPGITNVSAITLPSEVVQSTAISDRPKAKPAWNKSGKNARKQIAATAAIQAALQHQALAHITDQHFAQALSQQVGVNSGQSGEVVSDEMILTPPTSKPLSSGSNTSSGPSVLTATHIMAKVQQQLDYAVAVAQANAAQVDPSSRNNLADVSGCFTQMKQHLSDVNMTSENDNTIFVNITNKQSSNREQLQQQQQQLLQQHQEMFDSETFDSDFRTHVNQLVNLASTATNEEKMNFHKAMLKNLQKAAVQKGLYVDEQTGSVNTQNNVNSGLVGQNQTSVIQPGSNQLPVEHCLPHHTYPTATQGVNYGSTVRNDDGKSRMTRPSLVTPPPPPLAPPNQPPPSAQLLLKTPPPPCCDCHGHLKVSENMKESVQTGTQTTPGLLPNLPSSGDTKDQSVSSTTPVPTKSGKKARYHHQKSTQAPTSNVHQPSYPGGECVGNNIAATPSFSCMDVDSATDSNNDTALTLACAGGHEELVELLLSRGANIEHRDKKGFTPLILAATAGHEKVVEILLHHSADMEAQSERTKDTPLSLACSGGRYEVVELLLQRGANKEHRNVSDYTPLSLAASGGYVNIIKLLLSHGAEINSRTGSKLGISPLMLAAMNGHTAAVKLLLDMGSDINAQIETNRNTALTLACFQGRHEVVSLLLDRKANVEHRAKTGLTPLMEAASGGYVEVGRVLLDKGADVNAPPVPSSRDTALTIAADKGHVRFVELLLSRNAQVEVKNKKGNSPLWLAANGGHLAVVELLYNMGADIDSQDNRKVSCLMAAFRKGHVKVVKWMVNHVNQFPSDQEMTRYITTISDKKLLDKCHECIKNIRVAKDQQAAKANKNATILLEELYMEKTREESRRAAAARRRERKKKKKLEKRKAQEEMREVEEGGEEEDEEQDNEPTTPSNISDLRSGKGSVVERGSPRGSVPVTVHQHPGEVEEGDSGIDANSQGSCSSTEQVKPLDPNSKKKDRKKKKQNVNVTTCSVSGTNVTPSGTTNTASSSSNVTSTTLSNNYSTIIHSSVNQLNSNDKRNSSNSTNNKSSNHLKTVIEGKAEKNSNEVFNTKVRQQNNKNSSNNTSNSNADNVSNTVKPPPLVFEARHPADRDDFESTGNDNHNKKNKNNNNNYMMYCTEEMLQSSKGGNSTSPKQGGKREEPWKEVVRKFVCTYRSKKVSVPLNAISRVIGRGGSNINAIRTATGAHIEVEKQSKGQGERTITLKGSTEATKQAHLLITALIKDPEVDILTLLPKSAKSAAAVWEKSVNTAKSKPGVNNKASSTAPSTSSITTKTTTFTAVKRPTTVKDGMFSSGVLGNTTSTKTIMSYTGAIMTSSKHNNKLSANNSSNPVQVSGQTFAAKLSDSNRSVTPTGLSMACITPVQPVVNMSIAPLLGTSVVPPTSVTSSISSSNTLQSLDNIASNEITSPIGSNVKQIDRVETPPPTSISVAPIQQSPIAPPVSSVGVLPPQELSDNSIPLVSQHQPSQIPTPISRPTNSSQHLQQHNAQPVSVQSSGVMTSSQQSHSQCRTPTPPVSVPVPVASPQPPSQPAATFEYSLFNDNFTKVAQQMWGQRENISNKGSNVCIEKGMNFASVAATGAIGTPSHNAQPPKYLEPAPPAPPQVDASKAPGYRGSSVSSPVAKGQNTIQAERSPNNGTTSNIPSSSIASVTSVSVASSNVNANISQTNVNTANYYNQEQVVNHNVSTGGNTAFRPIYQDTVDILPHTYQPPHVSMSRLNPRAPDFSSSFKQQGMYTGYVPAGTLVGAPPPVPFPPTAPPTAKFPRPPPTPNGRWHLPPPTVFQMEMLACAAQQVDMSLQENGNGEDRKPRPIGTERSAWKNNLYTSGGPGGGPTVGPAVGPGVGPGPEEPWTLDQSGGKVPWVDRSHIYRQQQIAFPSANHTIPTRLQHLQAPPPPDDYIDQAYQNAAVVAAAGLESAAAALSGFSGGTNAGGLLTGGPLQFPGANEIHHAPQDLQCWSHTHHTHTQHSHTHTHNHTQPVHQPPDLTSAPPPHQTDKHGWTAKWNH